MILARHSQPRHLAALAHELIQRPTVETGH